MKISVISFSRAGAKKNLELVNLLQEQKHQAVSYSWHKYTGRKLLPFKSLKLLFRDIWNSQEAIILLWDMENVLQSLMPYLKPKENGPALLLMDEGGRFVIPLTRGKQQDINGWCSRFAELAGALPVNTAPDGKEEHFEADIFARDNDLHVQDMFRLQNVAEMLAKGGPVGIYSDYPVDGVLPEGLVCVGSMMRSQAGPEEAELADCDVPAVGISITDDWEAPHFVKECRVMPRNLVLGVACLPETDVTELERFVCGILADAHLSKERICAVFSGQREKAPAITALARCLNVSGIGANGGNPGEQIAGGKRKDMAACVYEKAPALHF